MRIAILFIFVLYLINYCDGTKAIVDAGSSGTRLYIFKEKGAGNCPVAEDNKYCEKHSVFTSKLGPLEAGVDTDKYLAVLLSFMNHYNIQQMAGGATAGVRNNDFISQASVKRRLNNAALAFLPGTDEAYFEWLAVNFDGCNGNLNAAGRLAAGSFRNFISAGGASAQAAFTITKTEKFAAQFKQLMHDIDGEIGHDSHDPRCNAGYEFSKGEDDGNKITYFVRIAIFDSAGTYVSELPTPITTVALDKPGRFEKECIQNEDQRCVVFFSFLAGSSDDAVKRCIEDYGTLAARKHDVGGHFFHNLVGGAKETFFNFVLTYLRNRDERIAGGNGKYGDRFDAARAYWTHDDKGKMLGEKEHGMYAALGLTDDDAGRVTADLAKWMKYDHYFNLVSKFVRENLPGAADVADEDAIQGEWYGVGSFAKKVPFGTFAIDAPFAWGNIFMEAMAVNYGLTGDGLKSGKKLGLANEGDWSFGLALLTLGGKCPEKCPVPVPDWREHKKVFATLDTNGCILYIKDFTLVPNDLLLLEQAVMSLL